MMVEMRQGTIRFILLLPLVVYWRLFPILWFTDNACSYFIFLSPSRASRNVSNEQNVWKFYLLDHM